MVYLLDQEFIDIYYLYTNELENCTPDVMNILDESEKETFDAYQREEKKQEFLTGRYLLKNVLSYQFNTTPSQIAFKISRYGKVLLDHKNSFNTKIDFNLSHAKGLVVCALIMDYPIGIDVEKMDRDLNEIGQRFFHPSEIAYIDHHKDRFKKKLQYELWTKKEAFVKAKGLGMFLPFNEFDICSCTNARLCSMEFIPDYIVSIAVLTDEKKHFKIRIHHFVD